MLYGVFGLPGAGKSYYVVKNLILERIVTGTVVSNIKLNDAVVLDGYIYLEKNDVDNLHNNLKNIIEDAKLSHDEKKVLIRHLLGLYSGGKGDITLIIDEAHLYGYRGRSNHISWADDWISIHRHVFEKNKLDLVLITQVPSRLNTAIGSQIEVAVQAVPSSQRLNKTMLEYSVYGSLDGLKSQDKDMRMKRIITKGKKEIFDIYQSGFVQEGSGDFRKKMYAIFGVLAVVVVYTLYSFMGLTDNDKYSHKLSMKEAQSKDIKSKNIEVKKVAAVDVNRSGYYEIICRTLPKHIDYKNVNNFMYVIFGSETNQVCFRNYEV